MRGLEVYRHVLHRSADQDRLVLMLHQRALQDLRAGELDHAVAIFSLLRRALDDRVDADLAGGLRTLYRWAIHEVDSREPARVERVEDLTRSLLETWEAAVGAT